MPRIARLLPALLLAACLPALACDSSDPAPAVAATATSAIPSLTPTLPVIATPSPPPATPAVAPTLDPENFPPAFMTHVARVEAALAGGDVEFFRERLERVTHVVCTEENTPPRTFGPVCESIGQEFEGVDVREERVPGGVETPENLSKIVPVDAAMQLISDMWEEAVPGASDQYGRSEPRVYLIAVDLIDGVSTLRGYLTVITAIVERPADVTGSGPLRVALILSWGPRNGGEFGLGFIRKVFADAEPHLEYVSAPGDRLIWRRYLP